MAEFDGHESRDNLFDTSHNDRLIKLSNDIDVVKTQLNRIERMIGFLIENQKAVVFSEHQKHEYSRQKQETRSPPSLLPKVNTASVTDLDSRKDPINMQSKSP